MTVINVNVIHDIFLYNVNIYETLFIKQANLYCEKNRNSAAFCYFRKMVSNVE